MSNSDSSPVPEPGPFSPARLAHVLAGQPPMGRLRVAFSGGADSLALLHALCALRGSLGPTRVEAVHVHHGLHPDADDWETACRSVCARLRVALEVFRVDAAPGVGESPEAAARRARYEALATGLEPGEAVCTAHHQRDQAETLLLQLLRGAGPAGLAGMGALRPLGRGWLLRPLLTFSPAALRDYLDQHGLDWIEDPANVDGRFDRNYLRSEIMPRLLERWPGAERTLARAAAHQADSVAIVDTLAKTDLAAARDPRSGTLSRTALAGLPPARARNLVRAWIAERGLPAPAAVHVQGILDELVAARDDAMPRVSWPGAEVRRHRDALHALLPMPCRARERILVWTPGEPLLLPHGRLEAALIRGRGLSAASCRDAAVEVRFRQGGERFRPAGQRHSTPLKKLLQASHVPPWLREHIPLIYVDGELAAVAGMWVGEGHAVAGSERGWLVSWSALPG